MADSLRLGHCLLLNSIKVPTQQAQLQTARVQAIKWEELDLRMREHFPLTPFIACQVPKDQEDNRPQGRRHRDHTETSPWVRTRTAVGINQVKLHLNSSWGRGTEESKENRHARVQWTHLLGMECKHRRSISESPTSISSSPKIKGQFCGSFQSLLCIRRMRKTKGTVIPYNMQNKKTSFQNF